MKIPFLNMEKEANFLIDSGLIKELEFTIKSGQYLFGPKSVELEQKLTEKFNADVILVGSGTDALTLSLLAHGIGPGKVVAIPAFSAIPTAVAVKMTGAKIKYLDLSPDLTGCINYDIPWTESLEGVSAIIPVHLYGNPMAMKGLTLGCKQQSVVVIEDCAQALGAKIGNDLVGTFGHTGAFSFYPSKNLGCFGDGGAVVTRDSNIMQKIKELRFYGQKSKLAMSGSIGMNSRMDELQCSILLMKLSILAETERRRLEIFEKYKIALKDDTIHWHNGCMPHLFPILVKNRFKFIRLMKEEGIETSIHYPFTLPSLIEKNMQEFPIAEKFASQVVTLPFHPWLTDEEVSYILNVTKMCLLGVK